MRSSAVRRTSRLTSERHCDSVRRVQTGLIQRWSVEFGRQAGSWPTQGNARRASMIIVQKALRFPIMFFTFELLSI